MTGKKTPVVSVVLPFHHAPSLKNAVLSILAQTFTDFELLLVDNANNANYLEEAQTLANLDPRIRLIREPKKGVVFATNTGIHAAKGEFIMRMDADDESFPNRMEIQLAAMEEDASLGVVAGEVVYIGPTENKGFITYVNWLNSVRLSDEISLNQFVEFPLANPSMMFRKTLFELHGYYQEGDFPEDYEFFLRLLKAGVKMTKVAAPVIQWIDSENRLTRTDPRYQPNNFHRIKSGYLAEWLKKHNPYHPYVYIWGAGRLSRRRSDYLKSYGIQVLHYVDVKQGSGILHYQEIPPPGQCFIVSYVSNRGVREEIRSFLTERGYQEGVNFILAA